MLALAYGHSQVADASGMVPMRRGVLAVVVGLLLVTMYNLSRSVLTSPVTIAVAGCAFLLVAVLKIGAAWIVVAAGVFGMMALRGAGQVIHLELFARFRLISLIAFGGGQAALPLIEQIAVQDTRWLTPTTFGTAVAFGYLTPGPVLITATFVGQQVGGLLGALAATLGAFLAPWVLSATAAQQVTGLAQSRWLRAFGADAGPAVIGLLGVTVLDVARESLVSWPCVAVSAAVFVLTARTRTHPIALLAAGAVVGWLIGQSQL